MKKEEADATAPTRLVTILDEIDHDGLLRRLAHVRALVAGGTLESAGDHPQGTEVRMRGADGTLVEMRSSNRGDAAGLLLRTDPSAPMSAFSLHERHPVSGPLPFVLDVSQIVATIDRWAALLRLPRFRPWGLQSAGDDPTEIHASRAATVLAAFSPDSAGTPVIVPVRNPYDEPEQVMVLASKRRAPCFDRTISDTLIAATEVTVALSMDGGSRHAHLLRAPEPIFSRRSTPPGPVERLRILADFAHVARPLTAAGRKARP